MHSHNPPPPSLQVQSAFLCTEAVPYCTQAAGGGSEAAAAAASRHAAEEAGAVGGVRRLLGHVQDDWKGTYTRW